MEKKSEECVKQVTKKRSFFKAAAISAFLFLTVGFFAPMEILLGNAQEFSFPLNNVWWILLVVAMGLTVCTGLLATIIPKKIAIWAELILFAFALCMYVQSLTLNGKMISVTGDKASYGSGIIYGNLAIWGAIVLVVILAYLFCKKKQMDFTTGIAFVSIAFILMQLTGCVSLVFTSPVQTNESKNAYLSTEGQFDLSKNKNLIFFILDTCDGRYVKKTLQEDPELFSGLSGFTYYPNMTSTFSRTYPSVPYLLTGSHCYFNKPYNQFVDESFQNSSFWKNLTTQCDDIRIYTEKIFVGKSAYSHINNYSQFDVYKLSALHVKGVIRAAYKIGLYRAAPYIIKNRFQYDADQINAKCLKTSGTSYSFDDKKFYTDLLNQKISADDKIHSAFRFYHLWGVHPGRKIDENVQSADDPPQDRTLRGDFKILNEYINQMKKSGVYDNSTIIITADHGSSGGGKQLTISGAPTCIMLVKPSGADSSQPCKVSNAPVSHADWFATAINSFGEDSSSYGTPIQKISENESRERYYYYSSLYSDIDGEIALREYKVLNDATDAGNWTLTGRNWNIDYSENTVSNHRLKTEEPGAKISEVPNQ